VLENLPPGLQATIPAPDGASLFASDRSGGLWRVPLDGHPATMAAQVETPIYTMAITPDGKDLAFASNEQVVLRELATGPTWWHRVKTLPGYPIRAVPARGGVFFIAGEEAVVSWWDPRTDQMVTLGKDAFFKALGVTASGDRAAWIDVNGTIFVADLAERQVRTLVGHHTTIRGFAMTSDGRLLATTHGSAVRVFSLPPPDAQRIELGSRMPQAQAVPARGEVVAPLGRALVAFDVHTGARRTLAEIGESVVGLAASPGGRRVALCEPTGRLRAVDLASGAAQELERGAGFFQTMIFADDDTLVGTDQATAIHVWNLAKGSHRAAAAGPRRPGRRHAGRLSGGFARREAGAAGQQPGARGPRSPA
jgi:hypothetical protein